METPLFGNYRAKVVNNRDPKKCGRVKLWIADIMPKVDDTKGLWAWPSNSPLGGRNLENETDCYYQGTSLIPKKGSWVFCFFESGNINRPYYFGSLDIEHPPGQPSVLPENQLGGEYEHKWTLFKSHDGRTIVVSDDPDDCRLELTGKKRLIKKPPHGDTESVYKVDENQTVILLDEREGKEKLLIRTYKGDFFHVDIDEQKLQIYFKDDITIKTDGNLHLQVTKDVQTKVTGNSYELVGGEKHVKTTGDTYEETAANRHVLAAAEIYTDSSHRYDQDGKAQPATDAVPVDPEGERDT
ncbi:hypothetical protein KAR91_24920 [Candidatus Pacearchaeota archaeon]|nr:hypothetical protein [Candidatus Pacearchaeota archaeon]